MEKSLLELLSFLRANQGTMVAQLHQFCEINSGTDNLVGLKLMCDRLQNAYVPIADAIASSDLEPVPMIDMSGNTVLQTCGNLLFIRKRPDLKRRVLLSGHMDTVYSSHHSFQTLNYINDNCINGPGVADMKGGLIVMLHALSAFEASPYAESLGWDVLINVYEPAMTVEGTLAKNRRGSGKLTLIATGKAAHVGRAFDEGRNAICFLAEAIALIHALNGKKDGVTINVGLIAGGDALNVVPDKAVAKLDIRINQPEDEFWVRNEIERIISKIMQKDYSLTVHGHFGRPVKRVDAGTQQLFSRVQHIGESLGLNIDWQDSGGCCDGNNLAQYGLPVLDTLGVRGGNIHSEKEFILLDSLVERAALSALLLVELAREGRPL